MLKFVVLLVLVVVCTAYRRPQIPTTFYMDGEIFVVHSDGQTANELATFYEDAEGKRASSSFLSFEEAAIEHNVVKKMFCAGVIFEIVRKKDGVSCRIGKIGTTFISEFDWVQGAKYVGNYPLYHQIYDVWSFVDDAKPFNATLEVARNFPNTPVFYNVNTTLYGELRYLYMTVKTFQAITPPDDVFDIPNECIGTQNQSNDQAGLNHS